jgi:uncharacterized membrane protein YfcA
MLVLFVIAFVILGLLAGLTVGLAGVGSTLLILPTLVLLLPHYMPTDLSVKIAIATTLACTSVSVIYAAFIHIRKGNVDVPLCQRMASVYVLTTVVGAYIVHFLPAPIIEIILGIVLIFVAAKMALVTKTHDTIEKKCTPVSSL